MNRRTFLGGLMGTLAAHLSSPGIAVVLAAFVVTIVVALDRQLGYANRADSTG